MDSRSSLRHNLGMSSTPNPFADEAPDATGNPVNPYASPTTTSPDGTGPGVGVWRDGPLLVFHLHASLPLRCVYTNEPCDLRRTQSLSYTEPWKPIPKAARFDYGVASNVESQDSRKKTIAGICFILSAAICIGIVNLAGPNSAAQEWLHWPLLVFGLIGFISLVFVVNKKQLKYARFEKSYLWLKGAGPAFLDSLPEWPGFIHIAEQPATPPLAPSLGQAPLNPFADDPAGAYAVASVTAPGIGIWRHGTLVVLHPAAAFPDRCIFTNEPAAHRRRQALNCGGLIETMRIEYGVSEGIHQRTQRNQRLALLISGFAIILLSVEQLGMLMLGRFTPELHMLCGLPLVAVFTVGLALAFSPAVAFQFVQGDSIYIWLKGAKPSFLQSLPEWPGYRR